MRRNEPSQRTRKPIPFATIGLLFALAGCSTPGNGPSAPVEARDASGFSITETARIPSRARDDFSQANQALDAGNLDGAIELLVEIARNSPELAAAQINLGIAYQRKNEQAQAESALLAALALNPRHPVALNELGIVYRRTGRFQEARTRFEAALTAYPEFHPAHKNLAILCDLYLADPVCALEHYERYRTAVPADEKVEMWIADLRNRVGR